MKKLLSILTIFGLTGMVTSNVVGHDSTKSESQVDNFKVNAFDIRVRANEKYSDLLYFFKGGNYQQLVKFSPHLRALEQAGKLDYNKITRIQLGYEIESEYGQEFILIPDKELGTTFVHEGNNVVSYMYDGLYYDLDFRVIITG